LCIECDSKIAELRDGEIRHYSIKPEDFGLTRASHSSLHAGSVQESRDKIFHALNGKGGAIGDIVLLNSAAGLYTSGVASSLKEGIDIARATVLSGDAIRKLNEFVDFTKSIEQ
jgi:anthranilate phosphoribosyltransferase